MKVLLVRHVMCRAHVVTGAAVALIAVCSAAATACGGGQGRSDGSPATGSPDQACRDTLGQPLKARDVVAAFRAEGFSMRSLASSFYCDEANRNVPRALVIVADISNRRSLTEDREIVDREGWATCHVVRGSKNMNRTLTVDLDRGADSPIFDGRKAVFVLANVDCSLYPHGERGSVQVRRAHAAMRRLERRLSG